MEIKDFIQHFAEQFDDMELSEFKPETVFHELDEYSSLIALSIIGMVDEEYGVTIGEEEMTAAVTIEDLFNTVKSMADGNA
jgi:acyl carrier protein